VAAIREPCFIRPSPFDSLSGLGRIGEENGKNYAPRAIGRGQDYEEVTTS
jgi:hypothetical protein